jgi:SEC-C motif-containing protein
MKPLARNKSLVPCPCGAPAQYPACCGRYLEADLLPDTPEALMRSRYVAYVLGRADYLLRTWHPSARPPTLALEGESVRWLGLQVRRVEAGGPGDRHGIVEFVARYKVGGRAHRLHESSRFVHEEGRWFYVDAAV